MKRKLLELHKMPRVTYWSGRKAVTLTYIAYNLLTYHKR